MITILVILFIILFLAQNFSSLKERVRERCTSIADVNENSLSLERDDIIAMKHSGYENEDAEIIISKATRAYHQLNLKLDAGLITETDFRKELSNILLSINQPS